MNLPHIEVIHHDESLQEILENHLAQQANLQPLHQYVQADQQVSPLPAAESPQVELISATNLNRLHTNQRLVVEALLARGAQVEIIDASIELLQVTLNGNTDLLLDRFSSKAPFHAVKLTADKWRTKCMLKNAGIEVPEGRYYTSTDDGLNEPDIKFPVVLKPNWGSHGDGVHTDVRNMDQYTSAVLRHAYEYTDATPFIVEQYLDWKEYRLFATRNGGFAVVHREPASVRGDGRLTIRQLIEEENLVREGRRKIQATSVCALAVDAETHRTLAHQGITLDFIPAEGSIVKIRNTSNLAKGGLAIDMTDTVPEWVKSLAFKIIDVFPMLPCVGIDLLCEDINSETAKNYAVIEVNSNPGLAMHVYPAIGISRPVHEYIADVMFT